MTIAEPQYATYTRTLLPLPQGLLRVVLVPAHEGAARQTSHSDPRREDSEALCLIHMLVRIRLKRDDRVKDVVEIMVPPSELAAPANLVGR